MALFFFMLRAPGIIPAGKVSDALVSQIDLYPSLAMARS